MVGAFKQLKSQSTIIILYTESLCCSITETTLYENAFILSDGQNGGQREVGHMKYLSLKNST